MKDEPQWFRNLRVTDRAEVLIGRTRTPVVSRVAEGAERNEPGSRWCLRAPRSSRSTRRSQGGPSRWRRWSGAPSPADPLRDLTARRCAGTRSPPCVTPGLTAACAPGRLARAGRRLAGAAGRAVRHGPAYERGGRRHRIGVHGAHAGLHAALGHRRQPREVQRRCRGLINFLAGWTFIGWIVALVMACGAHQVAYACGQPVNVLVAQHFPQAQVANAVVARQAVRPPAWYASPDVSLVSATGWDGRAWTEHRQGV